MWASCSEPLEISGNYVLLKINKEEKNFSVIPVLLGNFSNNLKEIST